MKNGIIIALLVFSCQLYGYQNTDSPTFAFVDLLEWKLREGSADNWAQEISPAGATRNAKVLDVPFNWDQGVRLGVGRNCVYDGWDTVLYYTWFQTKGTSYAAASSGAVYSSYLGNFYINNTNGASISGPTYQSANMLWKVYFNTLDFELGRTVKIQKFLQMRPFIGLKGAIINQRINTNWYNPTIATTFTSAVENLKNDFSGVGPSFGLDTTWAVHKSPRNCFNIIGNFSGALLVSHWAFADNYANNTPASDSITSENVNGASTMARGILGVEWSTYVLRTSVTLRLAYEAQVWFDQLQYYSFNGGRLDHLMSLQGGVLDFCVNF